MMKSQYNPAYLKKAAQLLQAASEHIDERYPHSPDEPCPITLPSALGNVMSAMRCILAALPIGEHQDIREIVAVIESAAHRCDAPRRTHLDAKPMNTGEGD